VEASGRRSYLGWNERDSHRDMGPSMRHIRAGIARMTFPVGEGQLRSWFGIMEGEHKAEVGLVAHFLPRLVKLGKAADFNTRLKDTKIKYGSRGTI
jgi:hypothetical protein